MDRFEENELGEADLSLTGLISPVEEYINVVKENYKNWESGVRGWESHKSMIERNSRIIQRIQERHLNKTIALIDHGGAGTGVNGLKE